jgi:hypothetical protein
MVRQRVQSRSDKFPMVTVVPDKVRHVAGMGNIALPGPGQQELGAGLMIFFKYKNPAATSGCMDRAEEPGRPGSNHDNVLLCHFLILQINAGALLMKYSPEV